MSVTTSVTLRPLEVDKYRLNPGNSTPWGANKSIHSRPTRPIFRELRGTRSFQGVQRLRATLLYAVPASDFQQCLGLYLAMFVPIRRFE